MTRTEQNNVYVAACSLGLGIFAARNFQAGDLLFQFTGPVIPAMEAHARGDRECFPLQIGPTSYVDLEAPGGFANHSCTPNAGIRDSLEVHALRAIRYGEEIRYDYSTTMSERRWTMRCLCGTASCRGIIGDFHDLPTDLQERYLELGIVQPFIVEECRRSSRSAANR